MKLQSDLRVYVWHTQQIKGIIYSIEYLFKSKNNKLELIIFDIYVKGKIHIYDSRSYNQLIYLSKGSNGNYLHKPFSELTKEFKNKNNWPKPYCSWRKLSDVVVPKEVLEYAKNKCQRQKV